MPVTTIIFDAGDTLIALNSNDTNPLTYSGKETRGNGS